MQSLVYEARVAELNEVLTAAGGKLLDPQDYAHAKVINKSSGSSESLTGVSSAIHFQITVPLSLVKSYKLTIEVIVELAKSDRAHMTNSSNYGCRY